MDDSKFAIGVELEKTEVGNRLKCHNCGQAAFFIMDRADREQEGRVIMDNVECANCHQMHVVIIPK